MSELDWLACFLWVKGGSSRTAPQKRETSRQTNPMNGFISRGRKVGELSCLSSFLVVGYERRAP